MVHDVAQAGFSDPRDYEAARPSYPAEAVDWITGFLATAGAPRVCDLAAGTGKLTRLLAGRGYRLFAVEPVAGMRATFRTVLPDVPIVAGAAEALPVRDASLDAVTVAQAWHWFDKDRAAAELRRTVVAGGRVVLVWNARDRSASWVDAVWSVVDRVEKRAPWRDHEQWRDTAESVAGFPPPERAEFRHAQQLTPEQVVQRVASVSHVAVLPDRERDAVLDEVRGIVSGHDLLTLPYRVDCVGVIRG